MLRQPPAGLLSKKGDNARSFTNRELSRTSKARPPFSSRCRCRGLRRPVSLEDRGTDLRFHCLMRSVADTWELQAH
jgi:hypothetical protein